MEITESPDGILWAGNANFILDCTEENEYVLTGWATFGLPLFFFRFGG
jgi:hypothetical protein